MQLRSVTSLRSPSGTPWTGGPWEEAPGGGDSAGSWATLTYPRCPLHSWWLRSLFLHESLQSGSHSPDGSR